MRQAIGLSGDIYSLRLGLRLEPQAEPNLAYTASAPCCQGTITKRDILSSPVIPYMELKA